MTPSASSSADALKRPIRTLVVDDSPTVRRLLVAILSSDPDFRVVGEASDGADAVRKAVELTPDLVTMDVHMPVADGIDATRAIMREAPTPILVVSSVAASDVVTSMDAIQAGALMVVEKPGDPASAQFPQQREQLLSMARAMAGVKVVRRWGSDGTSWQRTDRRGAPPRTIRLVTIGTSTGGPAALRSILVGLPADFPVPVLVVQHIARGFVDGLARWLALECRLAVKVAADSEPLSAGTVYLAPDNRHLGVSADGRVRLSASSPVGGFRPSADYLFDSCGRTFGAAAVGVILTGMGRDGVDGLRTLHDAGGRVIAQNEATSVVYGMAREAALAGVVDEILPVEQIAGRLVELVAGHD